MSEAKWTYGKFVTKTEVLPMISVGGTSYVDTTIGEWTVGSFVTPPLTGGIIVLHNQLPLPQIEPDEPEPDAGPHR